MFRELTPEEEKELEEQVKKEEQARKKYGIKKFRTLEQHQADQKRRKASQVDDAKKENG